MDNPYRTDFPGRAPFYGRVAERDKLLQAMRTGRRSTAAVMGGRGMGKTSFALRLVDHLREHEGIAVHLLRSPGSGPDAFVERLGRALGRDLDLKLFVESVEEAVRAQESPRVVLLIDEVEKLIASQPGCILLENLRIVWEALSGRLGVVVLGGSGLRKLLTGDASPFLRSAQWLPLRGLTREETAALLREPCELDIPDPMVDVLWEQSGGHPLLLQAIMEEAVGRGPPVVDQLPTALERVLEEHAPTLFPIWWDNLQERGRDIYRRLLARSQPLRREERVRVLGAEPDAWIEVLETTGVARVEGDEVLPRGTGFRAWMEREHPTRGSPTASEASAAPLAVDADSRPPLESTVVTAIARWARDVVEYPVTALKSKHAKGNDRLLPEQHFQLTLLMVLRQHPLLVEAEAWSVAGRSDLKVRWEQDPDRRACIEVKLWGRNDYADSVSQLVDRYAVPDDDFGCIVMLDRLQRPLVDAYRDKVLAAVPEQLLWPAPAAESAPALYPAFRSEHVRPTGRPLRVYHFLIQLPPD